MKLSPSIAKAVSIPRANLALEFMVLFLPRFFRLAQGCTLDGGSLATSIIIAKWAECNSFRLLPKRADEIENQLGCSNDLSGWEVWGRGIPKPNSAFAP
jgi:hypothetical protein